MWTDGVPVEVDAITQIRKMAALPVVHGNIAIMPDVHVGIGATVGSVIPTKAAIIPSAVGVDIGCGMCAIQTNLKLEDFDGKLATIRSQIERDVPVGFNFHSNSSVKYNAATASIIKSMEDRYKNLRIVDRFGQFDEGRMWKQLGTLGGGNHFIELCTDEVGGVWVMLHSGSRNIGKTIGECAINMAKDLAIKDGVKLSDSNLAWLPEATEEFRLYTEALKWAQDYAMQNRNVMVQLVTAVLYKHFPHFKAMGEVINCHHNYASLETHFGDQVWVTRKGAVYAGEGSMGIIPGSMGSRSYIVRGKGNAESLCSCSHGAGRRMSRGEAKRHYSQEDAESQLAGVECRKDSGIIDELPGAYKDIDKVMAAQSDLVEVKHVLKQFLVVKG